MGSVESSLAHPRDVFRVAAMASAAGVVVFHNHPTGDPAPSAEDRFVTDRLRQAGEVMGIELIDHIILGHGTYFSFREEARR
jgi:DNA repair protein RadC